MIPEVSVYFADTRFDFAQRQAEERGCTIELADDHTLQLDIDTDVAYDVFLAQIDLMTRLGTVQWNTWSARLSRSGHRHVTVTLVDPLPVTTRILLQACLGSDIKRELLSFSRVVKGQEHPVLLFRPKEATA